jgi:hypothetical protein
MTRLSHTHTVATLEVSRGAFEEISQLLREAEYDHAFDSGVIDMTGIGLVAAEHPPADTGPQGFVASQAQVLDACLKRFAEGFRDNPTLALDDAVDRTRLAILRLHQVAAILPTRWGTESAIVVRALANAVKKVLPPADVAQLAASLDPNKPLSEFLAFLREGADAVAGDPPIEIMALGEPCSCALEDHGVPAGPDHLFGCGQYRAESAT